MWSGGNKTGGLRGRATDVYVSDTETIAVLGDGQPWRYESGGLGDGLAALCAHLRAQAAPRPVRVWLGASLCRPVHVPAITGTRSRTERRRLAQALATAGSGLTPPCRVSIDTAIGADDVVAVVVEEQALSEIERALTMARLRMRSIRPLWGEVLASALRVNPDLRAIGVFEGRSLTVLTGAQRAFASAQALHPVQGVELARAAFSRALVSKMVTSDKAVMIGLDWNAAAERAEAPAIDGSVAFKRWLIDLQGGPL